MQGVDGDLSCFGLSDRGEPVFNMNDPMKYRFVGGYSGGVNLNHVLKFGITFHPRNMPEVKIKGFEAAACMLQRAGCDISAQEVEKEIGKLLKEKVSKIFCYRVAWTVGLKESYGLFQDGWLFSSAKPETDDIDFSEINDKLLRDRLKSSWRILTQKSLQTLRKSEFSKLLKSEL
jgi:hypothetical protein